VCPLPHTDHAHVAGQGRHCSPSRSSRHRKRSRFPRSASRLRLSATRHHSEAATAPKCGHCSSWNAGDAPKGRDLAVALLSDSSRSRYPAHADRDLLLLGRGVEHPDPTRRSTLPLAGPVANRPGRGSGSTRRATSATRQRTIEANGIDCGASVSSGATRCSWLLGDFACAGGSVAGRRGRAQPWRRAGEAASRAWWRRAAAASEARSNSSSRAGLSARPP
jgi:hypothetical protein